MAKDYNGIEIKVGDKFKHRYDPVPRNVSPPVYAAKMRRDNPDWQYFDGFYGQAEVKEILTNTVEVIHPGLRDRVPVFASSLLEVVS